MALTFINHLQRTVWNVQEAISYLEPKIWNMMPEEMKQKSFVFAFKRKIKQRVPKNWPCGICKNYLPNIRFRFQRCSCHLTRRQFGLNKLFQSSSLVFSEFSIQRLLVFL